jgi:hypothetical protein
MSAEVFQRSQERFHSRPRRQGSNGNGRTYLFAGMVHCATGHQPLSMQGKARKATTTTPAATGPTTATRPPSRCTPTRSGSTSARTRSCRSWRSFDERIFGPLRLEKLARQLKAHGRAEKRQGKLLATRLRQQIAEADRKIKVHIQALEDGIEPEVVTARITELKADRLWV